MSKQKSSSRGSSRRSPAQKSNSRGGAKNNSGQSTRRNRRSPHDQSSPRGANGNAGAEDYSQRLNKVLAAAGLGSRRQVEELIEQERVIVDNEICTDFSRRVDPLKNKISVDGEALRPSRPRYYALHKPAGVLCTNRDPQGRRRAIDLVPDASRLFPIGRLDANSTGLIILTNDGELTQRLAHPKYQVNKTYFVIVQGRLDVKELARLRKGIRLAEGWAKVENVKIRRYRRSATELEMVLSEGKNREIRRVLARLGHKVMVLRRLAIGPLRLANLPEGAYRKLTQDEVKKLYAATQTNKRKPNAPANSKRTKSKQNPKPSAPPVPSDQPQRESVDQPTTNNTVLVSEHDIPTSDIPDPNLSAAEIPHSSDAGWDDWDSTPQFLKFDGQNNEFGTGNVIDFGDESNQGFDANRQGLSIEDLYDEDSEFENDAFSERETTNPAFDQRESITDGYDSFDESNDFGDASAYSMPWEKNHEFDSESDPSFQEDHDSDRQLRHGKPTRRNSKRRKRGTTGINHIETAPDNRKPSKRKKGYGQESSSNNPSRKKSSKKKRVASAGKSSPAAGRRGAARTSNGRSNAASQARKTNSRGSSGRKKSKRR